jgi:hypothetical protein
MKTVTTLLFVLLSTALIAGAYLSDEGLYGSGTSGISKSGTISSAFLEFDGIASHVQLSEVLTIGSTSNTIEAWIKVPVKGTKNLSVNARVGIILGNFDDNPNANWEIHSAGQMRLYWKNNEIDVRGTTDLRDNEWHHVAFVRDTGNDKIVMYVDGEEEGLNNIGIEGSGSDIDALGSIHRIGADNRSSGIPYFHGKIAEIRIWNTARTQQEIKDNMNALDGSESGLVAHYTFDNISETTLPDNMGDNNGTLQNFTLDVTTQAVTDFTANSAVGNASIKGLGFPFPTAHGFCWSINTATPTIADHSNNLGGASSIGTFSANITELSSNTTYYVRAYASNDEGTSYGEVVVFETQPILIYRSVATGNWNDLSTWEQAIADNPTEETDWAAATSYPGQVANADGSGVPLVKVRPEHVVRIDGYEIVFDHVEIKGEGKIIINKSAGKLTINGELKMDAGTSIVME